MTTWEQLVERYAPLRSEDRDAVSEEWPEQIELSGADPSSCEGMPDALARRIALFGPEEALRGIDAFLPWLDRVLKRMEPVPQGADTRYAVTVLSLVSALRCCGQRGAEQAGDEERERRWLSAVDPAAQSGVRRGADHAAIAAAGAGLPELALRHAAEDPGVYDHAALFGCEVSAFAAHVARARQQDAGPDGVSAAWESFLRNFPDSETAGVTQWLDLLWAARAVYALLGDTPVGAVGARLHEDVRAAAERASGGE